jgi:hypothetical protein
MNKKWEGKQCSLCFRKAKSLGYCTRHYTAYYYNKNKDKCRISMNKSSKIAHDRDIETVINHYGGECKCCGEKTKKFLTIDHTDNDGNVYRKLGLRGRTFYRWIIKNKFPDDLEVSCFNCNCGRQRND